MIFMGKYVFKKDITGLIVDLNCLKELKRIIDDNNLSYNITIDYKNGDTINDLSIKDIEDDISKNKRQIKEFNLRAGDNEIAFNFDNIVAELQIESNDKSKFLKLKQQLLEWFDLYKDKNILREFAPLSKKSETIRVITSFLLAIFTTVPFIIYYILNAIPFEFATMLQFFVSLIGLYFLVLLVLSSIFLRQVEIDIGTNKSRIRRKVGKWVLTVVIIPIIISWIFAFV